MHWKSYIPRFIPCFTCVHYYRKPRRSRKPLIHPSLCESMVHGELSSISAVKNKDSVVRIVLASRMVEVYDCAIVAHTVMKKYPGLCLTRPEIFKRPHESVIRPGKVLLPGQKFYLVPETTVKKLLQKHPKSPRTPEDTRGKAVVSGEPVCSAKDFYASNDKWTQCFQRRSGKESGKKEQQNKDFMLPIRKLTGMRKGLLGGWRPNLAPVEEISP